MRQPVKPVGRCKANAPSFSVRISCECGWSGVDYPMHDGGKRAAYADLRKHWIECGAEFDPQKVRRNGTLIKE